MFLFLFQCLFLQAQVQPYAYYTFDGGSNEQWQPWTTSSTGYAEPQCSSVCSNCQLTLPSVPPLVINTAPQAIGNYALFNTTNAQLRNTNISLNSKGISFEALIRFDDAFGVQRRANLLTLSRSTTQTQPGTFLNFYLNFDLTATDGGAEIVLFTDANGSPSTDANTFSIELTGLNRRSTQYYLDNNWHQVAFTYIPETGLKKIWVDGVSPEEFTTYAVPSQFTAQTCSLFVNSTTTYDKMVGGIDELAYYNEPLTDEDISQHYTDFKGLNGIAPEHYTFRLTKAFPNNIVLSTDPDPNEFPFGHTLGGGDESSYFVTHSALEQLYLFPLPRYKPGNKLHKNMNLVRSKWIGENSSSDSSAKLQTSLDIQIRLASKWNYYFNLSESLPNEINDVITPGTYAYKWMNWVSNPSNTLAGSFEYSLFTNRSQLPGGSLVRNQNFGNSTNQQSYYSVKYDYVNNNYFQPYKYLSRSGAVTTTKTWLPIAGITNYTGDGVACKVILDTLLKALQATPYHISYITDNNEAIPVYDANVYDNTNNIPTAFKDNFEMHQACPGCTQQQWREFLGDKKVAIDNVAYRTIILNDARLTNTNYLNYGVDGGPDDRYYWPKLRQTQRFDSSGAGGLFKNAYSTMDFYPITPSRWRLQVTNLTVDGRAQIPRGWRWLARSRKEELAAGDKLFAPYVGAGWFFDEERNFRPGQWLGLMKCMGLTGVDFYHAYYDEISANPKGYIWQAAIPSYAQAILSRIDHLILYGNVLEGNVYSTPSVTSQGKAYAFNTGNPLQLVVIRQDADSGTGVPLLKYAISGSIQKLVNMTGDEPLSEEVNIDLNAGVGNYDSLRFSIRRQGSTYIFDRRNSNDIVFYQLDKWHQWEHPERWSKDFELEAELFDNGNDSLEKTIHTENENHFPITNGDYRNFTSYIAGAGNSYQYHLEPIASGHFYIYIKARMKNGGTASPSINISFSENNNGSNALSFSLACVAGTSWMWYMADTADHPIELELNAAPYLLSLQTLNNDVLIDKIYISTTPFLPDNVNASVEAACPGPITITANTTPVTCYGAATGSVDIMATGGFSNYDYSINNGSWQNGTNHFLMSNLVAGNYYIRARSTVDTTLRSGLIMITVTQPATTFAIEMQVSGNCNNSNNGKVTAVVTGGNMNAYEYNWNTGASSSVIDKLSNGTYTVTVTDAKGCLLSNQAIVNSKLFSATASVISPILTGCGSAKLKITINSGSTARPPYFYSFDGGITYRNPVFDSTLTLNNQVAGTYLAIVKDYNGCIATMTGDKLTISGTVTASITSSITPTFTLRCHGDKTNLSAHPTSGYKYLWSTGLTSSTISNIAGGVYQVTVTQTSSLCTAKAVVTIKEPDALKINVHASVAKCAASNDGNAIANVTGGTGSSHYLWSTADTTAIINGLAGGNYSVLVTDDNGCTASQYFSITKPNLPLTASINVIHELPCGDTVNGSLNAIILNGVSPISLLWSNGSVSTKIDSLKSGIYILTVTDANGCSVSLSKALAQPPFTYYADVDGDNYGDQLNSIIGGCIPPTGYLSTGGDCNDANPAVNPLATELCNGIDDNCDGDIDLFNSTLNVKCFIQGYYAGSGLMRAVIDPLNLPELCDTIEVELHSLSNPMLPIRKTKGILNIYGQVLFSLQKLHCGDYFIGIHHQNGVETWSKYPINFGENQASFDFADPY